ncbi:recombinase family protein [Spirosoma telluris]|uniref:recombinase family protein n=1 Tax=Spirosoma telluris TaxID=2183553 RepID=UPI002FC3D139
MPESPRHRPPTQNQNLALQLDALKTVGCSKIFPEKASGSKTERPELNRLLEINRERDMLMIWKRDGAGRPATGPFTESLD